MAPIIELSPGGAQLLRPAVCLTRLILRRTMAGAFPLSGELPIIFD